MRTQRNKKIEQRKSRAHQFIIKVLFLSYQFWLSPLSLDLGLEEVLQGNSVGGELGDTLAELLDGHGLFVEVESEESLILEVRALGDVEGSSAGGVEFLGDGGGGVQEVLEKVGLYQLAENKTTRARQSGGLRRWSSSHSQRAQ
jgi:hypothetical protein